MLRLQTDFAFSVYSAIKSICFKPNKINEINKYQKNNNHNRRESENNSNSNNMCKVFMTFSSTKRRSLKMKKIERERAEKTKYNNAEMTVLLMENLVIVINIWILCHFAIEVQSIAHHF